jgi:hypothetical protein
VRPVSDSENDTAPLWEPSVEVAMTVVRDEEVPYANPDCVALLPPVAVIVALRVVVVFVIDDAVSVVSDGAAQAEVRNVVLVPYEVPAVFVEYER